MAVKIGKRDNQSWKTAAAAAAAAAAAVKSDFAKCNFPRAKKFIWKDEEERKKANLYAEGDKTPQ